MNKFPSFLFCIKKMSLLNRMKLNICNETTYKRSFLGYKNINHCKFCQLRQNLNKKEKKNHAIGIDYEKPSNTLKIMERNCSI